LPVPGVTSMQFVNQFFDRLTQSFGPERAQLYIDEALSASGLSQLRTADEVLLFANNLMQRGGFFEVMGGALRVQAILRGGNEAPRPKRTPTLKPR
jgi:hypothetical protein